MITKIPVAFFWEVAVPVEIDHLGPMVAGHLRCGIGTIGIDHYHLPREIAADCLQADSKVALLVTHGNGDGEIMLGHSYQPIVRVVVLGFQLQYSSLGLIELPHCMRRR